MKKIGEYTARGIVSEAQTENGEPQKIPLFDGRFDTAYRITEFHIWSSDMSSGGGPDCVGKLSKNAIGTTTAQDFFRADDDNQIAWAGSLGSSDSGLQTPDYIIDPDNLVVEDLYVYVRGATTNTRAINYLIIMEKYEITDWQGALAMARDKLDGE